MEDNMQPEESPNVSVTKASKFPLYLFLGIAAVVIAAIVYGGYKKYDDQKKKKAEKVTHVDKPVNSKATIDNLINSYQKEKAIEEKLQEKKDEEKKDNKDEKKKQKTPEEQWIEKIKMQKISEFEKSVAAPSGIGEWSEKPNDNEVDKSEKQIASINDTVKNADKKDWDLSSEVEAPKSPYMLRAGHVFPAVMVTGINSDLAGKLIAQVSENIYDTATHKELLIPQGTRLFGEYTNDVEFGQERLLVSWNRLTFPDGKVMDLGEMPGTDPAGYSGFKDQVNHHYLRIYGNALLMSAVVGAVALSQNQNQGIQGGGFSQNSNSILSQSLGQTLGQATTRILQKNINIAPTIEIRPGYAFNVMVTKDITFNGEFQSFDY